MTMSTVEEECCRRKSRSRDRCRFLQMPLHLVIQSGAIANQDGGDHGGDCGLHGATGRATARRTTLELKASASLSVAVRSTSTAVAWLIDQRRALPPNSRHDRHAGRDMSPGAAA